MNRLVRRWTRPRAGQRTLLFTLDRPRSIDRVIDYFGDRLGPALVAGARANTVGVHEASGFTRRWSIHPTGDRP